MGTVRMSGIYAEALARLLSGSDVEVSVQEEHPDAEMSTSVDTLVYDKEDRNGFTVHGALAEKIVGILKERLPDAIHHRIETGTIYCGLVREIDRDSKRVLVNIGKEKPGELPLQNYWGLFKEGEKVLVQVKGESRDSILLSTQLRLFGDNLILIKDGFTKVSKHIRDVGERNKLLGLSETLKVEGWGILWKALAEKKDSAELKKEMESLINDEGVLRKGFDSSDGVKLIKEGFCIHFIDLGRESKSVLDSLRSEVAKTMPWHHTLRSMGYSLVTELGDRLPVKDSMVKDAVMNVIKPGQHYRIIQNRIKERSVSMDGRVAGSGETLMVRRNMSGIGSYRHLNIPKKRGDYAIISLKDGQMFVEEAFFDADGNVRGKVFLLSTPVEVSPGFARYIWLGGCVVEKDGRREAVDMDAIEAAFNSGHMSKDLKDRAMKIARDIESDEIGQ